MNQNPYEDHRLRVVRKTQGTLQDNKNDSHLELWGSYSRIRTKSHKNEIIRSEKIIPHVSEPNKRRRRRQRERQKTKRFRLAK